MKKIFIVIICFFGISYNSLVLADPPLSADVANTMSNYWVNAQMDEMGSFITNLYISYSNYVPALLAATFYDVIYKGHLNDAKSKLLMIQNAASNDPAAYNEEFTAFLASQLHALQEEIDMHTEDGTTESQLESNAAPDSVRSDWGATSYLPPDINIIFYAPSVIITNAP